MCINPIKDFEMLAKEASKASKDAMNVAVVNPADEHTAQAVAMALEKNLAKFTIFVTPEFDIKTSPLAPYADKITVEICDSPDACAAAAIAAAKNGRAGVVMKGLINTDNLMRAILNKETGILPAGNVLSHITAVQPAGYGKLIFFSDAAVIPYPDLRQRKAIAGYLTNAITRFGIARPKIALIHCTEKTSPKFPVTLDYQELKVLNAQGEFAPAVLDGPMDVKSACDAESAAIKGIESEVCGHADGLIFSDIQAANVFYKTITCFSHATTAGVVVGASVPVVVPSRSDSAESKFYSLAFASLLAK